MKSFFVLTLTVFSLNAFAQSTTGTENDPMIPNSGGGPRGDEKTIDAHEGAIKFENQPAVSPDTIDPEFKDKDSFSQNRKNHLINEKKKAEKKRKKEERNK